MADFWDPMPYEGLIRDLEEMIHGLRNHEVLDWKVATTFDAGGLNTEVVEYEVKVKIARPPSSRPGS